jgi:hypothetical protein
MVWTGAQYLAPTGIHPRTFQPVSESLYRLSYPAAGSRVPSYVNCVLLVAVMLQSAVIAGVFSSYVGLCIRQDSNSTQQAA